MLFFLAAMLFLIFCGSCAEVYDDPGMCFSLTGDGWIKDIFNAFEIRASEANLYEFDAFSALTLAAKLGKADFEISRDPLHPFSGVQVYFDNSSFRPVSSYTEDAVRIVIGAVLDKEKTDPEIYAGYASLKYSVIGSGGSLRDDILIWANSSGKQIPIDGIFWLMELPGSYTTENIAGYGAVLNYLTRFVNETKQSGLDFKTLLSQMETDETGKFKNRTVKQLTGRGYSVGLIADPRFVFLTIADSDTVLFRDSGSVTDYYGEICKSAGVCRR